jgi:hypothetical protein
MPRQSIDDLFNAEAADSAEPGVIPSRPAAPARDVKAAQARLATAGSFISRGRARTPGVPDCLSDTVQEFL